MSDATIFIYLILIFLWLNSLPQVYIYNDRVVSRGVRPNLVDLFKEASVQFENKVSDFNSHNN